MTREGGGNTAHSGRINEKNESARTRWVSRKRQRVIGKRGRWRGTTAEKKSIRRRPVSRGERVLRHEISRLTKFRSGETLLEKGCEQILGSVKSWGKK